MDLIFWKLFWTRRRWKRRYLQMKELSGCRVIQESEQQWRLMWCAVSDGWLMNYFLTFRFFFIQECLISKMELIVTRNGWARWHGKGSVLSSNSEDYMACEWRSGRVLANLLDLVTRRSSGSWPPCSCRSGFTLSKDDRDMDPTTNFSRVGIVDFSASLQSLTPSRLCKKRRRMETLYLQRLVIISSIFLESFAKL